MRRGIRNILAAFKKLRAGTDLEGVMGIWFCSHLRYVEQLSGCLHNYRKQEEGHSWRAKFSSYQDTDSFK